jgi:hypothetical protein
VYTGAIVRDPGDALGWTWRGLIAPLALALTWAVTFAGAPACGGHGSEAGATATPVPSAPSAAGRACDATGGGPAGPITDPNGPYYHSVAIARTTDGVRLTNAHVVLDHASVPDGVARSSSDVLVYYVNGAMGYTWVGQTTDGASLNPLGPLTLNGVSNPAGVVDPDAFRLPDGRIRLAYLAGLTAPSNPTPRAICLADSTDGMNFTVVGSAYDIPTGYTITDPSLARLADGSWLMALSRGQQTVMARSADGLRFTVYDTLSFGGVPELTALADGRVRLYVCASGIASYTSANNGQSWAREASVAPPGTLGARIVCDPSYVPDAGLFVFKIAQ